MFNHNSSDDPTMSKYKSTETKPEDSRAEEQGESIISDGAEYSIGHTGELHDSTLAVAARGSQDSRNMTDIHTSAMD